MLALGTFPLVPRWLRACYHYQKLRLLTESEQIKNLKATYRRVQMLRLS